MIQNFQQNKGYYEYTSFIFDCEIASFINFKNTLVWLNLDTGEVYNCFKNLELGYHWDNILVIKKLTENKIYINQFGYLDFEDLIIDLIPESFDTFWVQCQDRPDRLFSTSGIEITPNSNVSRFNILF